MGTKYYKFHEYETLNLFIYQSLTHLIKKHPPVRCAAANGCWVELASDSSFDLLYSLSRSLSERGIHRTFIQHESSHLEINVIPF